MDDATLARQELGERKAACVVVREGVVESSQEQGVKPLLLWLSREERVFSGACVADKVVGKAAALLFIYGGVSHVYAKVISEHAAKALEEHKVPFAFEERVPFIVNRTQTGMCPMEQRVLAMSDPKEAYQTLKQAIPL